ncbi:MAG: hypothetical protein JWL69_1178 [Phycisphaerales bacterium]|nr:hypothetical protein [Phycisphaerales bacterium]MDB5354563.1 hypothetical protein [Phycisphaerales bacterium]
MELLDHDLNSADLCGRELLGRLLAAQGDLASLPSDPHGMLAAVAGHVLAACGADAVAIESVFPACRATSGGALPAVADLFTHRQRAALLEGDAPPFICDDVQNDPRASNPALRLAGVRSFIVVPLAAADRAMGFLVLASLSPDAFDAHRVACARLLGTLVSAALQNAAECEEKRVLEMVAKDQPLPEILDQLVKLVERQTAETGGCVLLVVEDGTIQPFAPGLRPELTKALERHPVAFAARLAGRLSESDTAPCVADVATDPAWEGLRDEARADGIEACWVVPIYSGDRTRVGLAVAFAGQNRGPSRAEAAALSTAARLAGIAIEHHQTTRQLAHLVRHDVLTGLPNRILFEDRLFQALNVARRSRLPLALVAIDLDHFKQVNDSLGHQAGDALLRQFARRVRSRLRESDTLARVGGDEFMLILPDVTDRAAVELVAGRLRDATADEPFDLLGFPRRATASFGVALFPEDAEDAAGLQRIADAAMYRIKEETHRHSAPLLPPAAESSAA